MFGRTGVSGQTVHSHVAQESGQESESVFIITPRHRASGISYKRVLAMSSVAPIGRIGMSGKLAQKRAEVLKSRVLDLFT